jgi:hypothetical protein
VVITDCYALEDRVAIHFAVMGSLPGLGVAGGLALWPATDERLVVAGATAGVTVRVGRAGDVLESLGSREPMAMTASTAMMARLKSSSVTAAS